MRADDVYAILNRKIKNVQISGGDASVDIDNIIEGLTEKEYLKGLVSEADVVEMINKHTEDMKDEIRSDYQQILNQPTEFLCVNVFNPADKFPGAILTFEDVLNLDPDNETTKPSRLIKNDMEIDQDGYVVLKSGHIYCIYSNIMLRDLASGNSSYTSDIGFSVVGKDDIDITNGEMFYDKLCPFYAEANIFSSLVYPFLYTPKKDYPIALRIQKDGFTKVRITSYAMSVFEIKQPLVTQVPVADMQ